MRLDVRSKNGLDGTKNNFWAGDFSPLTYGPNPIYRLFMEQKLIEQIEAQAAKRGMAASTLCRVAVNDGKLYARLKSGKTITLATIHRLNLFFKSPVKKATTK